MSSTKNLMAGNGMIFISGLLFLVAGIAISDVLVSDILICASVFCSLFLCRKISRQNK